MHFFLPFLGHCEQLGERVSHPAEPKAKGGSYNPMLFCRILNLSKIWTRLFVQFDQWLWFCTCTMHSWEVIYFISHLIKTNPHQSRFVNWIVSELRNALIIKKLLLYKIFLQAHSHLGYSEVTDWCYWCAPLVSILCLITLSMLVWEPPMHHCRTPLWLITAGPCSRPARSSPALLSPRPRHLPQHLL